MRRAARAGNAAVMDFRAPRAVPAGLRHARSPRAAGGIVVPRTSMSGMLGGAAEGTTRD